MASPYGLGYGLSAIGANVANKLQEQQQQEPYLQRQQMLNAQTQAEIERQQQELRNQQQASQLMAGAFNPDTGEFDRSKVYAAYARQPKYLTNFMNEFRKEDTENRKAQDAQKAQALKDQKEAAAQRRLALTALPQYITAANEEIASGADPAKVHAMAKASYAANYPDNADVYPESYDSSNYKMLQNAGIDWIKRQELERKKRDDEADRQYRAQLLKIQQGQLAVQQGHLAVERAKAKQGSSINLADYGIDPMDNIRKMAESLQRGEHDVPSRGELMSDPEGWKVAMALARQGSGWDVSNSKQRITMAQNWARGPLSISNNAANTLLKHVADLIDLRKEATDVGVKSANKAINLFTSNVMPGGSISDAAQGVQENIGDEATRLMTAAQGSAADRKKHAAHFDINKPESAFKQSVDAQMRLFVDKLGSNANQYQSVMHLKAPPLVLDDDARAAIKKIENYTGKKVGLDENGNLRVNTASPKPMPKEAIKPSSQSSSDDTGVF